MAKFKVLKYNQVLMSWQGIHSMNLAEPTNEFLRSPSSYYVTFTLFAFVVSSAVRIHGYWPEIALILKPCSVAFGGVQCVGMFICIGSQMKCIKTLHLELQRIIDEGICSVSRRTWSFWKTIYIFAIWRISEQESGIVDIYWSAERKCRKYTRRISSYFFVNESIFLTAPLFGLVNIIMGNLDVSTWALPMDLSVPFDTNTVWGWLLSWFFQFNISICYVSCTITITTYFVCCCIYIDAICEHFSFVYDCAMENVERNRHETDPQACERRQLLICADMNKAAEIHAKIFELVFVENQFWMIN